MFGRKRKLLSKKETSHLWDFWWSAARTCAHELTLLADQPGLDGKQYFGAVTCDVIDEFYDAIVWLETL